MPHFSKSALFDDVLVESAWVAGASSALQALCIWQQGWANTFSLDAESESDVPQAQAAIATEVQELRQKLSGLQHGAERQMLLEKLERLREESDGVASVWACGDDGNPRGWAEVSLQIKDGGDVCSALQAIWLQNVRHDQAGVDKSFEFARRVNGKINGERAAARTEELLVLERAEVLMREKSATWPDPARDEGCVRKRGTFVGKSPTRSVQIALVKSHSMDHFRNQLVPASELVEIPGLLAQLGAEEAELVCIEADIKAMHAMGQNEGGKNRQAQSQFRKALARKKDSKMKIERLRERSVVVKIVNKEEGRDEGTGKGPSILEKRTGGYPLRCNTSEFYIRCKIKNLYRLSAREIQGALSKKLKNYTISKHDQEDLNLGDDEDRIARGDDRSKMMGKEDIESISVPLMSVCVQGGPGTVKTVRGAAENGTPVLVLRGSGKAADLIADAVMLQYAPSHPAHCKHRNAEQREFWTFLSHCGVDEELHDEEGTYGWDIVIRCISQRKEMLKQIPEDIDFVASTREREITLLPVLQTLHLARRLVKDVYQVAPDHCEDAKCLDIITDTLKCAKSRRCWVYDLQSKEPGYDDFNGALLKCLLNGVSTVGEETETTLWTKLKYTMLWSRDDIMDYILERMSKNIEAYRLKRIFDKALLFALMNDKQHALCSLLERGSSLATLDVGNGFCFVKHYFHSLEYRGDPSDTPSPAVCAAQSAGTKVRGAKEYFDAARNWKELIDHALLENAQFASLWHEYKVFCKEQIRPEMGCYRLLATLWDSIKKAATLCLGNARLGSASERKLTEKYHPDLGKAGHPIPESMRLDLYSFVTQYRRKVKKQMAMYNQQEQSGGDLSSQQPSGSKETPKTLSVSGRCRFESTTPAPETAASSTVSLSVNANERTFASVGLLSVAQRKFGKNAKRNARKLEEDKVKLRDVIEETKLSSYIILLEGLYMHLLGPKLRYRMGVQGPALDLFFWNVLQQKRDLAMEMWRHVDYPVRSALFAAYLLRMLAKNEYTDAFSSRELLSSASFFEQKAIDVQDAAREDNRLMALRAVDTDLYLFKGMSLLDLAVVSECLSFVQTECCTQAIEYRFYGDLSPTQFETRWGQIKFIFAVMSFGLLPTFVRDFVDWTPPPESNALRRRTQRRPKPEGYPNRPSENKSLQDEYKRLQQKDKTRLNLNEKDLFRLLKKYMVGNDKAEKLTTLEMDILWAQSFSRWSRLHCFLTSPFVLFVYNAIVTLVVTVSLTIWFLDKNVESQGASKPREWMMKYFHVFFACSSLREAMQLFMLTILQSERVFQKGRKGFINGGLHSYIPYYEGLKEYCDLWNLIDVLSPICWLIGSMYEMTCSNSNKHDSRCRISDEHGFGSEPFELSNLFYSFCIFLCWCRVLRIFYVTHIGLVIDVFLYNFKQFSHFVIIYVVLLLGFCMLFIGVSGDVTAIVPNTCSKWMPVTSTESLLKHASEDMDSGILSCMTSYWFIRPLFQSFGEFALNEVTNVPSLVFLIFTFVILNLMLINLFIAMMTATFETMSQQAKTKVLIYKYHLLAEHSRTAISVPVFLNLPMLFLEGFLFWYQFSNVKRKYPDALVWQRFDLFLARNQKMFEEEEDAVYKEEFHKVQARVSAFMERARAVVLNKVHPKDSLEGKVDSIASACEHMQVMSETIRGHVQRGFRSRVKSQDIGSEVRNSARTRELLQHLQSRGRDVGKLAVVTSKLKSLIPASRHAHYDLGMTMNRNPHGTSYGSRKHAQGLHSPRQDLDDGEAWDAKDIEINARDIEINAKDVEIKALKTMNSRLLTLCDPKSAQALIKWQNAEDPRQEFRSALQAIAFAGKIIHGGEESDGASNFDEKETCNECKLQDAFHRANRICIDCAKVLCDYCHQMHHSKHRTARIEQQASGRD